MSKHSTFISQNCEHSILFISDMWENKKEKKRTQINTDNSNLLEIAVLVYNWWHFQIECQKQSLTLCCPLHLLARFLSQTNVYQILMCHSSWRKDHTFVSNSLNFCMAFATRKKHQFELLFNQFVQTITITYSMLADSDNISYSYQSTCTKNKTPTST